MIPDRAEAGVSVGGEGIAAVVHGAEMGKMLCCGTSTNPWLEGGGGGGVKPIRFTPMSASLSLNVRFWPTAEKHKMKWKNCSVFFSCG